VPIAVELKRVDHMLMGPGKPWISERLLWWALNEKDTATYLLNPDHPNWAWPDSEDSGVAEELGRQAEAKNGADRSAASPPARRSSDY